MVRAGEGSDAKAHVFVFRLSLRSLNAVALGSQSTAAPSDPFKAWFPAYKPSARPARLRILCFPNAGSAENVFTGGYLKDKKRSVRMPLPRSGFRAVFSPFAL